MEAPCKYGKGREDLWRKAGDGVFLNCCSQEMCTIDHAEHVSAVSVSMQKRS